MQLALANPTVFLSPFSSVWLKSLGAVCPCTAQVTRFFPWRKVHLILSIAVGPRSQHSPGPLPACSVWRSSAQRVQTGGLNPYSWLSLPPHCRFGTWAASLADGKASRMLLGSRSRAQVFSDKDLGLGFPPVGYRQQIHALLILPLTNSPAQRISSKPN